MNKSLIADALESKSWPFEEAKKILKRIGDNKKNIIFETGYGTSGLKVMLITIIIYYEIF